MIGWVVFLSALSGNRALAPALCIAYAHY